MPHSKSVKLRLKPTSKSCLHRNDRAKRRSGAPSQLRRTFRSRTLRGRLMLGPMQRPASSWRSTIIDLPAKEGLMTPNIDSIIRDHVTLTVRCLDRIYLQGYMPKLQTSGGLCYFLRDHLGYPIPSPALFRPMHDRFVNAVKTFAANSAVPLIPFESGQD